MGIVRFALKFPYTFYVLAVFILFLGVSAITVMPEDIFPEINIPVVSVIWQYTGLSVPEMEQRVTTYSQYSISSNVTGIKNMEAQTLNGISVQKIYFQPDVNLDLARATRYRRMPPVGARGGGSGIGELRRPGACPARGDFSCHLAPM
jgi:multidrug efflux pump subunit AcrB